MHVMNSNLNDMEWNVRRGILIDEDHMKIDEDQMDYEPAPDEDQRKKNGHSHTKSHDTLQNTGAKLIIDYREGHESINTLKGFGDHKE